HEGAGFGDDNFSVLGVTASVNSCAGNALGRYYRDDRVLVWRPELPQADQDPFYVEITNTPDTGTDTCDAPDEPAPPPAASPVVRARPDVHGDEASAPDLLG